MMARGGWRGVALSVLAGVTLAVSARAQVAAPPPVPPEPMLDPTSPLAPLPGIGVDWPDLASRPGAATIDPAGATSEKRYAYRIDGLGAAETPMLSDRFDELSTLRAHARDAANAAQLDRRAREDAKLLTDLLRGEGYYDARVATRVDPSGERPTVVLDARPGGLYRLTTVTIEGLSGAKAESLRDAFGVKPEDALDADRITAGQAALRASLGRRGFAFAQVGEPDIVIDRAARTATLTLQVSTGGERRWGRIIANPNNRVFDANHVAEIARFRPGRPFDAIGVEDLRRALIQTGLVSVAEVKPVEGAEPGTVDVAVTLEPAPPRTVAAELGYGTGEGARAELSWTHRNLFPPEGALILRSVLGTREQLGGVTYRRNNFHGRDRVLTGSFEAAHTVLDAYAARTFTLSGSLERQTNIFFQKTWTWSLGGELVDSNERDSIVETGQPQVRTFFIAAAPTSLNYDGSNDLLNPTRGFRLGGRLSPELSLQGAAFGYARAQIDASVYRSLGDAVVLAGRVRLGTIAGAPRDKVAPSRRFYAGGGASVRGYGYQRIGPRDANNNPIGGRSLSEFSIEARVKVVGALGLVPFLDAGNISTGELPPITGLRAGTGLGVRYYSSFGPIRVDLGTPLNPQAGDPRVAVYVSLGQAF